MKRILIRSLIAALAGILLLTAVSCDTDEGGIETIPQKETTAAPDTADTSADTAPEQNPNQAPDFTVQDWEGNMVKLSDFFGKPIVLNFWASWCPPCKAELPDFDDACKKYDGEVVFLMVNMTDNQIETVEVAKDFIKTYGYDFPVYFDVDYEAAMVYGIRSIPQTYFINAEGEVVTVATGMISASQLEQRIGMIYSE
jgi:thiol-disulfide isomerase/thioredoxin